MSFFQEYKHLDAVCKEYMRTPKGITSYIDYMKAHEDGASKVPGWSEDLRELKRLRHIRNRIAHDDGINEKDVTTKADERWLKEFAKRVEKGTDPIYVYKKKSGKVSKIVVLLVALIILLLIIVIMGFVL